MAPVHPTPDPAARGSGSGQDLTPRPPPPCQYPTPPLTRSLMTPPSSSCVLPAYSPQAARPPAAAPEVQARRAPGPGQRPRGGRGGVGGTRAKPGRQQVRLGPSPGDATLLSSPAAAAVGLLLPQMLRSQAGFLGGGGRRPGAGSCCCCMRAEVAAGKAGQGKAGA